MEVAAKVGTGITKPAEVHIDRAWTLLFLANVPGRWIPDLRTML